MELTLQNEQLLVSRLKEGDVEAFDTLFNNFSPKLYRFAFRYLKSKEDSEEVVQEVFLKVWEKRAMLQEELSFSSFLFTITQRVALNVIRKKRNSEKATAVALINIDQDANFVEDQIFASQLMECTKAAVDSLSPQRKRIFTMSREQYLSYEQIAKSLNISKNTVEVQMVLALKHVRKYLTQFGISNSL